MGGRSRNSRKKYRKTKPQRILIRCGFLVGAGGCREPRKIKRNPGRGSQRLRRALGGTRILLAAAPTAPPCFCRWQRSSLLHRGFPPPDYSAGRCCSNPPLQPLFKADKTETPVPGSDTGVLGGRVWIARAALLKTAHWAVFALSSATAPQLFESTLAAPFSRQVKQKLRYPLDTGVLGGAKQPKSEPLPSGASLAAISSKVMVFVPSL